MDVKITCTCPGEHGEDTVTFMDRLDTHSVLAIKKAVALIEKTRPMRGAEVLATLSECYVIYGVQSWTIVGQKRKLLEIDPYTTRTLLEHPDADILIDAADDLYQEQVLLPLARAVERSSGGSQTAASTSPTPLTSKTSRKKRSTQSSTSTTPTDATVTTSSPPDGDSNFSPSLVSAAS